MSVNHSRKVVLRIATITHCVCVCVCVYVCIPAVLSASTITKIHQQSSADVSRTLHTVNFKDRLKRIVVFVYRETEAKPQRLRGPVRASRPAVAPAADGGWAAQGCSARSPWSSQLTVAADQPQHPGSQQRSVLAVW